MAPAHAWARERAGACVDAWRRVRCGSAQVSYRAHQCVPRNCACAEAHVRGGARARVRAHSYPRHRPAANREPAPGASCGARTTGGLAVPLPACAHCLTALPPPCSPPCQRLSHEQRTQSRALACRPRSPAPRHRARGHLGPRGEAAAHVGRREAETGVAPTGARVLPQPPCRALRGPANARGAAFASHCTAPAPIPLRAPRRTDLDLKSAPIVSHGHCP